MNRCPASAYQKGANESIFWKFLVAGDYKYIIKNRIQRPAGNLSAEPAVSPQLNHPEDEYGPNGNFVFNRPVVRVALECLCPVGQK